MSRCVLIVDDDDAFRGLAARVVTGWGHTVVGEAASVAQAVQQARQLQPDVALVDIGLPDGDGLSLAERLRALPRPVSVVLISSDGDRANVDAARRVGAVAFVPKTELPGPALRQLLEEG